MTIAFLCQKNAFGYQIPFEVVSMPYIFVVDEKNFWKCLQHKLFGVPNTTKAIGQIMNVKKGEKLFLYVFGKRKIFGIYEAITMPFREQQPERGPWIGRRYDEKHGFFPYRIEVDLFTEFAEGVPIEEVERKNIGINRYFFNGKSVGYVTEYQAKIIEELLKEVNIKAVKMEISFARFPSNVTPLNPLEIHKEKESILQVLIQQNIEMVEKGLKIVDSYFPVRGYGWGGEIDILAKDMEKNYVIIELKMRKLPPQIWSQLLSYSYAIRNIFAKFEKVDVRTVAIGKGFEPKTLYVYPELKLLLKKPDLLRAFKYVTDFRTYVELREVDVKYIV